MQCLRNIAWYSTMLLLFLLAPNLSVVAQTTETPRIVYFTTHIPSETNILSPLELQSITETIVVKDLEALEALEGIDALILDDSSITLIDQEWLTEQISSGAVVAFLNTSVSDAAELMENPCLTNEDFEANESSYIIASQYRYGVNTDEVERVWNATMKSCDDDAPVRGIKSFVSTGYSFVFEDKGKSDDFSRSLKSVVQQMQRTKVWALSQRGR